MNALRFITLTILLTVSGLLGYGQVRVTGHVSAEVVESISAGYNGNSHMTLNAQEVKQFELGSFNISGISSSTCSLIIGNANISNNRGESFSIKTNTANAETSVVADKSGNHSLNMTAGTEELLASGQYQGNYGVTFAYN